MASMKNVVLVHGGFVDGAGMGGGLPAHRPTRTRPQVECGARFVCTAMRRAERF